MSSLTESLQFDDFFLSYLSFAFDSIIVKCFSLYSLAPGMCKGYRTEIKSYTSFYIMLKLSTQSVSNLNLEKWLANLIFRSNLLKHRQIQPDLLIGYFSSLQLYHINLHFLVVVFSNSYLVQIIIRARSLLLNRKSK